MRDTQPPLGLEPSAPGRAEAFTPRTLPYKPSMPPRPPQGLLGMGAPNILAQIREIKYRGVKCESAWHFQVPVPKQWPGTEMCKQKSVSGKTADKNTCPWNDAVCAIEGGHQQYLKQKTLVEKRARPFDETMYVG